MGEIEKALSASHGLLSALESVRTKANEALKERTIPADIHRLVMLNVREMYGAIKTYTLYQEQLYSRQGGSFYTGQP